MTATSILDVQVSCFKNYEITFNPKPVSLLNWLKSDKYAKEVAVIRNIPIKKERDKEKAKLPAITPGGIFSYRATKNLVRFSGLMQLDIDLTHNPHISNFDDLKKLVNILPYVAYCGASVSGLGYWLLVPIRSSEKYKDHFEALEKDWKEVAGIIIDTTRKDIAGLRGYSYDPEAYFNHQAQYYTKIIVQKSKYTWNIKNNLPATNEDVFSHTQKIIEDFGLTYFEGYRHHYIVKLCQYLNRFGITQDEAESWIYKNLPITPEEIKSNCISQPYENGISDFGKYKTVFVPFDSIEDYNENSYRIRQKLSYFYIPKATIEITDKGCYTQKYIVENSKLNNYPEYTTTDFRPINCHTTLDCSTPTQTQIPEVQKMQIMQPPVLKKEETNASIPVVKFKPLVFDKNEWVTNATKTIEKPVRPATGKLKMLEDRWIKDKTKHKRILDIFQSMKIASIIDQFKREKPSDSALEKLEQLMFGETAKQSKDQKQLFNNL